MRVIVSPARPPKLLVWPGKLTTTPIQYHPPIENMAPARPRIQLYHQTLHFPSTGKPVSLLPLVSKVPPHIHPHLVLAIGAIHLNNLPAPHLTVNDTLATDPCHITLLTELPYLRNAGITITAMLGGAAQGTFARLDLGQKDWNIYYKLLSDFLHAWHFDGVDLDVEEDMTLSGMVRLIWQLRADFGPDFVITQAPVAAALQGRPHLSGFNYDALEAAISNELEWYNAQFYCGWGSFADGGRSVGEILGRGWDPSKVVVGVLTNPQNGDGYVELDGVMAGLKGWGERGIGGVAAWEIFNALPGGEDPEAWWEWVQHVAESLGISEELPR